jgi:hypothetical protein
MPVEQGVASVAIFALAKRVAPGAKRAWFDASFCIGSASGDPSESAGRTGKSQ